MALQHLRSSTANKRPIPTQLSAGQIAVNTNEASPGLFFKDSNGDLVKIGPVHVGTSAPNSSPASTAATALVSGTVYQILTVGTTDFTAIGASANTVGVVFTATGAGTGTGTVSGQQGNEKGEQWLDTTGGAYDLKIYDGSAWRSQAGEFVNVTGDTMTGALLLDNAASANAPDLSFDGDANTGIYSPGADQVAISTGGSQRLLIENTGLTVNGTTTLNGTTLSLGAEGGANGFINAPESIYFNIDSNNGETGKTFVFAHNATDQTGTELFRIQDDGKIGVGTTSPGSLLNISSSTNNSSVEPKDDTNGLRITNSSASTGSYTNICLEPYAGDVAFIRAIANGNNDIDLDFGIQYSGQSSATSRMRIGSSGNVGIGRTPFTTAGYPLQLRGSSQAYLSLSTSSQGDTATDGLVIGTDNSSAYIYQRENAPLAIHTNNQERLRIDSSGRLLAGTTTEGHSSADDLTIATTGDTGITIRSGTSDQGNIFFSDGTSGTSEYRGAVRYYHDLDELELMTAASGRMRIDSSGRLLVGTSSASSNVGVIVIQGYAGVSHGEGTIDLVRGNNVTATTQGLGSINFGHSQYQGASIDAVSEAAWTEGSSHPSYLAFSTTASGSSSPTERMRIDSSGNVSINSGKLELGVENVTNGIVNAPEGLYLNIDSNNDSTSEVFVIAANRDGNTGGSELFRIGEDGNVGIGTSSPTDAKLVVTNSTDGIEGIRINDTRATPSVNKRTFDVRYTGTNGRTAGNTQLFYLYDNNSSSTQPFMEVENGSGSLFVINSSGNVGIGTTSPSAKLEVDGQAYFTDRILCGDASGTQAIKIPYSGTATAEIKVDGSAYFASNVGIGTTSPAAKLEIGNITQSGTEEVLTIDRADGTQLYSIGWDSSDNQVSFSGNTKNFVFKNGSSSSETMRIDSSGRVLIGVTSNYANPNCDDLIVGNNSASGTRGITIGAADAGQIAFADAGDARAGILLYNHSDSSMRFYTSGASNERMRITSGGGIGFGGGITIGNTTPTSNTAIYIAASVIGSGAGNSTLKYNFSSGLVSYDTSSRLVKENITDCPYGIEALKQLQPRKYFRTDDGNEEIGFIADELVEVLPEFVPIGLKSLITKNAEDTEEIPLGVNYDKLTAVLTAALQEAIAKIETLEAKVAALEAA